MKRILVLGKNGYVSNCFQTYMKQFEDYSVVAISVRDNSWEKIDFSIYDSIFNTVGLAHNDARKGTDEEFINLNVNLPVKLASKAKLDGCKQFIHMSSMIVYGDMSELGSNEKINEKTVPNPSGIYGKSKLAGEEGLKSLVDDRFHVAIIRSPLIYSENAVDNFLKLTDYAVKHVIFPNIENSRSMIYSDNLCELVKLIVDNNGNSIYYPQQDKYICTSKLVKDVAKKAGHTMILVKIFNPILYLTSKKIMFIRKVFGNLAYDQEISNCFDGQYRVVDYNESVMRLARMKRK